MSRRSVRLAILVFAALGACHQSGARAPARAPLVLAPAESMFQALHQVKDRIGVTSARGSSADTDGTSLEALRHQYASIRAPLAAALASIDSAALSPED